MSNGMQSFEKSQCSSSHSKRYQRGKNSGGLNEMGMPYFEQETSETIHNLQEEVRYLRKQNKHLQQHIEAIKEQYDELKNTIEYVDLKEKEQIKKNNQMHVRINQLMVKWHETKNQRQLLKMEKEDLKNDIMMLQSREEDWRKKMNKLKQIQAMHLSQISELQSQIQLLNAQLLQRVKNKSDASAKLQISELKQQITLYMERLSQANLQKERQSNQLEKIKSRGELSNSRIQAQQNMSKLEKELFKLREELQQNKLESQKTIQGLKNKLKNHQEELNELENQIIKKKKQNRELNSKIQEFEIRRKQKKVDNKFQQKYLELSSQYEEFKFSQTIKQSEYRMKNEQIEREKNNLISKITNLQKQIYSKQHMEIYSPKIDKNNEQVEDLSNQLKQITQKFRNILQQLEKKNDQMMELKDQLKKCHKQRIKFKEMYEELKQQKKNCRKQCEIREIQWQAGKKLKNKENQDNGGLNEMRLRQFYEGKIAMIVKQYQEIQRQLISLQQEIVSTKKGEGHELFEEQRRMHLETIKRWQFAYEELQAMYEAKLVSKQEQINLLTLKLANKYDY